ncbi:conserved hypothetical protein [Neospora caninum Liverpool]|uniref:RAP domain-containing protein n=1 Tax=Neospora caninum (strain Liverpool) TaxID=572307 RepID=F0VIN6_NEOCL|nr:conserved hypothetical protein [Neospora caninum Liverpool]CBZ53597.1 conserved hypothetical protein [Neospora caninum Liverpool]|eukprot:XP_003883629.1 conserved hypothetical protein [Neospora caninum Liverpool]
MKPANPIQTPPDPPFPGQTETECSVHGKSRGAASTFPPSFCLPRVSVHGRPSSPSARGFRFVSSSAPSSSEASLSLLREPAPLSLEDVLQILDFRLREKHFVSFAHEHEHNHPAASIGLAPGEFVVALNRVAAAAAEAAGQTESVWRDIRFQKFLARLKKRLLAFKPAELYRTLVAFSRLAHCPEDILSSILRLLDSSPPASGAEGDLCASAVPEDGLAALSPQQLSHFPVLLCPLSHGASREVIQEFLQSYCRFLSSSSPSSPSSVSSSSPSSPSSHSSVADEGDEMLGSLPARLEMFSLQELSFIVLGLSTVGFRDLPFLGVLAHAVQTKISSDPFFASAPRQTSTRGSLEDVTQSLPLAVSLLSFATLGVVKPRMYQEIFTALRGRLRFLPPSQLANITLALATLTREPANPFPLAFLSVVEDALEARCVAMDGEDTLTAAWAACALNLHQGNPALFRRLVAQCVLALAPDDG